MLPEPPKDEKPNIQGPGQITVPIMRSRVIDGFRVTVTQYTQYADCSEMDLMLALMLSVIGLTKVAATLVPGADALSWHNCRGLGNKKPPLRSNGGLSRHPRGCRGALTIALARGDPEATVVAVPAGDHTHAKRRRSDTTFRSATRQWLARRGWPIGPKPSVAIPRGWCLSSRSP